MPPTIALECVTEEGRVDSGHFSSGSITIGREPENRFPVDSVSVSRRHGCILEAGNQWVYRDLGSTNGSWVNGVHLQPSQLRILRDGDVLQLAGTRSRVSISAPVDPLAVPKLSLLIFLGEKFQSEFPLMDDGGLFVVGGSEGHIYIDRNVNSAPQLEITTASGQLELTVGRTNVPVLVNGMAVGGTALVGDCDEISVGPYRILANNSRSSKPRESLEAGYPGATEVTDSVTAAIESAYASEDWESEASRRRSQSGRRFVFGAEGGDAEHPAGGTLSMPYSEFASKTGYDMNVSRRLSGVFETPTNPSAKLVSFLVLFFLVLLVSLAVFVLLQLMA